MALYAHYLYCGLWTGSVHVWNCGELHDNAIYEEPDRALQGHDRAVRAMVVHQGHLFTGSEDGLMCVWSVPKHELIKVVKVGHPVLALSIYKDHVFVNGKQEGVAAFYTTGAATSI
jgi:WD40 repeat protein